MPDMRWDRREKKRERLRQKLKLASNRKALFQIEQAMTRKPRKRRGRVAR